MPQSIPPGLTRDHVLQAIADLDGGIEHPFGTPFGYELVHHGKRYSPKAVVGLACRYSIGRVLTPEEFSGGEAPGDTNFLLRKLGFTVVHKTVAMTKLFISYRREDTEGLTGRIYDRLVARFGKEAVFMDNDTIPFGVDFVEHISGAVSQCDILLVMIGENWLDTRHSAGPNQGKRRLDDPNDFVRIEIQAALERNIPVIPVLMGKATMPAADQLPADIKKLSRRNATEIRSGRDFHNHVDRLIRGIEFLRQMDQLTPMVHPPKAERKPGEIFTNSLGMKFAWIPPGAFLMGSPRNEKARSDKETQHKVTLTKGFYMGVNLVTQEQWQAVMSGNPSHYKGEKNLPVDSVSWDDCQEFIKKLREKDQKPYRLPTEAEWEYACRAGTTTPFYFGSSLAQDQANCSSGIANSLGRLFFTGKTTPVCNYPPNAWGLHDMHGNLWEWCQDWNGEYPKHEVTDPQGPNSGKHRVLRGGSWFNNPDHCRSAGRNGNEPGGRSDRYGFRLCFCQD